MGLLCASGSDAGADHVIPAARLERINANYADNEGVQRHSDMVWRVLRSGRWLYLYLLLEFQSAPDPWMALRMRVYTGLLYQDLVKRHELPTPGCLPPVLPIVRYTGRKPWRAARSMQPLIMPGRAGREARAQPDD